MKLNTDAINGFLFLLLFPLILFTVWSELFIIGLKMFVTIIVIMVFMELIKTVQKKVRKN